MIIRTALVNSEDTDSSVDSRSGHSFVSNPDPLGDIMNSECLRQIHNWHLHSKKKFKSLIYYDLESRSKDSAIESFT